MFPVRVKYFWGNGGDIVKVCTKRLSIVWQVKDVNSFFFKKSVFKEHVGYSPTELSCLFLPIFYVQYFEHHRNWPLNQRCGWFSETNQWNMMKNVQPDNLFITTSRFVLRQQLERIPNIGCKTHKNIIILIILICAKCLLWPSFSINRRYKTSLSISNVNHILVVSRGYLFYIGCCQSWLLSNSCITVF